jgi:hypothetical protein
VVDKYAAFKAWQADGANQSVWTLRCPSITSSITNPTWTTTGLSPGLCSEISATTYLIYVMTLQAHDLILKRSLHSWYVAFADGKHFQKSNENVVASTDGNLKCLAVLSVI